MKNNPTMKQSIVQFSVICVLFIAVPVSAAPPPLPLLPEATLTAIPICYDFGCKTRETVALSKSDWKAVSSQLIKPAATPAEERANIREAISWMELAIGRLTPTDKDLPYNLPPTGYTHELFPGQLDCIDEASNTTTYLKLFEKHGLLKHHSVSEAAYRSSWFDYHWAGQIQEKESGEKYVVDSWFGANGYEPIIQDTAAWSDISRLTAVVDNSPDQEGREITRSRWHRFLRGE